MFLVGFELIFYDGKVRNIGRENKIAHSLENQFAFIQLV